MVLIDRIVAVIVSAVLVLMGFTVQQRAQQTSVGSAMLYAGKKQTLELADLLERDLANVGFDIAPGQEAITDYSVTDDNLERLQFFGSNATGNQIEIRYDLVSADSAQVGEETVALYALERYEKQDGVWQLAGGSPATLTRFYIDLLSEANSVVPRENTRRIRVWLENAVMPEANMGETMQGFRLLRWSVTLNPTNLRGYQAS